MFQEHKKVKISKKVPNLNTSTRRRFTTESPKQPAPDISNTQHHDITGKTVYITNPTVNVIRVTVNIARNTMNSTSNIVNANSIRMNITKNIINIRSVTVNILNNYYYFELI